VILLTITATQDTSDSADSSSTTSSAHPVVQSTGSKFMTFEVGNYQFFDDLEYYVVVDEDSASMLKTSWALIAMASLFMMSFASVI